MVLYSKSTVFAISLHYTYKFKRCSKKEGCKQCRLGGPWQNGPYKTQYTERNKNNVTDSM